MIMVKNRLDSIKTRCKKDYEYVSDNIKRYKGISYPSIFTVCIFLFFVINYLSFHLSFCLLELFFVFLGYKIYLKLKEFHKEADNAHTELVSGKNKRLLNKVKKGKYFSLKYKILLCMVYLLTIFIFYSTFVSYGGVFLISAISTFKKDIIVGLFPLIISLILLEIGFGSLFFIKFYLLSYTDLMDYYLVMVKNEKNEKKLNAEIQRLISRLKIENLNIYKKSVLSNISTFIILINILNINMTLKKEIINKMLKHLNKEQYSEIIQNISEYDKLFDEKYGTKYFAFKNWACAEYNLKEFEIFDFLKTYAKNNPDSLLKRFLPIVILPTKKILEFVWKLLPIATIIILNKYFPDSINWISKVIF
jgi:hypothetical protein